MSNYIIVGILVFKFTETTNNNKSPTSHLRDTHRFLWLSSQHNCQSFYDLVFRQFKRQKHRYVTDAEKKGYSWVFFTRSHISDLEHPDPTKKHPAGPWWVAIRGANWERVGFFFILE